MSNTNQEDKCVWMMGTPCSGKVEHREFFTKQLKVPVCESHLEQHTHIMILAKNKYDVEQILQETPEYRKEQVLILQLSGLDVSNVEI